MKNNNFEIKYNSNGKIISEHLCSKMNLVTRYIEILNWDNFGISCLKAFKNDRDITAKINEFLSK